MKKIPTLFERQFENNKVTGISDKVVPGFEWVLAGEGVATVKIDGACCAIIDGEFYKRFDAKKGRKIPEGAIPCCDPDPVTGHWPHWVKVDPENPADKWFCEAFNNSRLPLTCWEFTCEAVGPHFQGNPQEFEYDRLVRHGDVRIPVERSFEGIKKFLEENYIEGLVFWKDGEPQCKIKRTDFGFEWPVRRQEDA